MDHAFQTSDEQYAKLAAYAAQHGQTPETLFQEWVSKITRDTEKLPSVKNAKSTGKERQDEAPGDLLLKVAGMFAIGEPGWADRHDEYLTETYLESHADSE